MRTLRRLLAGTSLILAVAAVPAAATASAGPATLVSFPGVARALAVDGGRVAWIDTAWALRVRTVHAGRETKILYTNPSQEFQPLSDAPRLMLEGHRLLWLSSRSLGTFDRADRVYTASLDAPRPHPLVTVVYAEAIDGSYLTGIAGDRSGFSYGVAVVKAAAQQYQVAGGGVWSVVAGRASRVPGIPPALVLARADGRVAVDPADTTLRSVGTPVGTGTVEIRDAVHGTLVSTFSPGPVRAGALSATIAAVLVGRRIARYAVADGRLLGSTTVPADTAGELAVAAGPRIVFRTSRSVRLLDAASGRVSTLATTAPWRPTHLASDGRTVVWTESRRIAPGDVSRRTFLTRIRAVTLGR